MSPLPKLKIKLPAGNSGEDIFSLEQARDRLNFDDGIIMVEGQTVHSYEELLELSRRENYRNREFLEVVLRQVIVGG
jgi:PDZ domain-containing secreted protein